MIAELPELCQYVHYALREEFKIESPLLVKNSMDSATIRYSLYVSVSDCREICTQPTQLVDDSRQDDEQQMKFALALP